MVLSLVRELRDIIRKFRERIANKEQTWQREREPELLIGFSVRLPGGINGQLQEQEHLIYYRDNPVCTKAPSIKQAGGHERAEVNARLYVYYVHYRHSLRFTRLRSC